MCNIQFSALENFTQFRLFRDFLLDFLLNGKKYTSRGNNCLLALIRNSRSSAWKTIWWQAKMHSLVSIHHWNWQKKSIYTSENYQEKQVLKQITLCWLAYIGNENIGVSNVSQPIILPGFCFNNDIKKYFVCEHLRKAILEKIYS